MIILCGTAIEFKPGFHYDRSTTEERLNEHNGDEDYHNTCISTSTSRIKLFVRVVLVFMFM